MRHFLGLSYYKKLIIKNTNNSKYNTEIGRFHFIVWSYKNGTIKSVLIKPAIPTNWCYCN